MRLIRPIPYAHTPARATFQVVGDLLLVTWVWFWVSAGFTVRDAVARLAEPGRRLEQGAGDVATSLRETGDRAASVPFIGDRLRAPLDSAGDAADSIAAAGHQQVQVVNDLAVLLGLVVAAIPVLLAVLLWVPGRVRFARRAAAARRFIDADADLSLFALRAMANQPMHRLARVSGDPVSAWRAGDPAVVRALADLELRDAGLRAPARLAGSAP